MPKTPKKKSTKEAAEAKTAQSSKSKPQKAKVEAAKATQQPAKVKQPAQSAAKPVKKAEKQPAASAAVTSAVSAKSAGGASKNYFYANGKRKTAVASIRLIANGKGVIIINNRPFENYFPLNLDQDKILAPMRMTNTLKMFDISARAHGGGIHAQAEAVRHGISKALLLFNPELRSTLKHVGFLTRDSRVKERKKYGLKRARKAPQWAKR